uniref:UmuC domain-containing protein n=1 Tax=Aegilops tauschii subsp. strangulata TaxID=200361 RepID=A0A453HF46_AEGTS
AAMPGFIGCKLCPDLVFVRPNFGRYTHYSGLARKVFQRYDPNFFATSLDEAYLDITEVCSERGITGEEVASELRDAVHQETGLTCSAGVAPNRMIAKVCSDINKPNGQFILPNDRDAVTTFVSTLPIRKVLYSKKVHVRYGSVLLAHYSFHIIFHIFTLVRHLGYDIFHCTVLHRFVI